MTDSAPAKPKWRVIADPIGMNPGYKPSASTRARKTGGKDEAKKDNVGGVVIYVVLDRRREEVARVGFVRETSENPNVPFQKKLDEVIATAKQTADTLNTLTPDGELL